MTALTIDDLLAFDPGARAPIGNFWSFRCPEAVCAGNPRRTLSVDLVKRWWRCHRCNAWGRIDEWSREGAPLPQIAPCDPDAWRVTYEGAGLSDISGTPGELYLKSRGIPVELAQACGIQWARRWYGRPAIMFPITNGCRELVAVQGRFRWTQDRSLKSLSRGPVADGVFQTPDAFRGDITICEAPIDALSLAVLGVPAVATCGTAVRTWLLPAGRGRRVNLAHDADEPGETSARKWIEALRPFAHVAWRLRPPNFKDWNAELTKGKF